MALFRIKQNNTMVRQLMWLLNTLSWYLLLVFIIAISFTFGGYASPSWLKLSGYFYLWFCFASVLIVFGGRFNKRAFRSAKPTIILLFASIIWLGLPLIIPYQHELYDLVLTNKFSGISAPEWFDPNAIWSTTPQRNQWLLYSEVLMLCLFLSLLSLLDSRQRLKQVLIVMMFVGVLHACIGLIGQYQNVLFVNAKEVDGHFAVARGLFINRNHFAGFLVTTLAGTLAYQWKMLLSSQNLTTKQLLLKHCSVWHLVILIFLALVLAGIVSSQSRAPALSLLVGFVAVLIMVRPLKIRNIQVLSGLSLAAALIALLYFGQDLIARLGQSALALGERAPQWAITFDAIKRNAMLGYGGGSYGTVFQLFREQADLRDVVYAQSHNHYLHLWLERGLVGLLLWLTIITLAFIKIKRAILKSKSALVVSVLLASMTVFIAALIQSIVDFNLQILNMRAYFFFILAIMFAAPHISHKRI